MDITEVDTNLIQEMFSTRKKELEAQLEGIQNEKQSLMDREHRVLGKLEELQMMRMELLSRIRQGAYTPPRPLIQAPLLPGQAQLFNVPNLISFLCNKFPGLSHEGIAKMLGEFLEQERMPK